MRSERRRRLTPRILAVGIVLLSCGARGSSVHCSPTPGCSLAPERFEPPPLEVRDASASSCDPDAGACAAAHVAAGRSFTCALAPSGEVLCWGDGSEGQLGGSSYPDDGLDAGVGLRFVLDDARIVTAGDAHACAATTAGRVLCWGRNAEGQVDGVPSDFVGGAVVVADVEAGAVSAGAAHTCSTGNDGITCWGSARYGQVGREVVDDALAPDLVPDTAGAVFAAAGARHTCAQFEDGHVACWGERYDADTGAMRSSAVPEVVAGLHDAVAISAGAGFTCALRAGGAVACWGANESGQLGDGTHAPSAVPVAVEGIELALEIEAGGAELDGTLVGHACAITKSFFVQCWGRNREGQLGQADPTDALRAVTVRGEEGEEQDEPYLPDVTEVAVGGFHTCSIDHDGPVLCWGADDAGQLGASEPAPFGHPVEAAPFRGEY